jgi:hypothetical protein
VALATLLAVNFAWIDFGARPLQMRLRLPVRSRRKLFARAC